ncbi:MAG: hypothetical protein Q8W47_00280 [Candidatus Palauibacterales bacterium]|nr:hypothetical protein [Candidatus Palauibacterales bacterium]
MERLVPARAAGGPLRTAGISYGRILAAAAGLALAWTGGAGAQEAVAAPGAGAAAAPASIPVVERFDPATGRRARRTVAHLTASEALSLQRALARAGHDPGVRSGALDPATRSALSALERDRGLAACGCPSYAAVVALGLQPRVVETVVAAGGRGPAFAHPTAGAAEVVAGRGAGAAGGGAETVASAGGPVSVSTEAGVVVVRGSGSGGADGRTGRMPAGEAASGSGGAAGAAGPASSAGPASPTPWPGYGAYFAPPYRVWLLPAGRGPGHGGRGGRLGQEDRSGSAGGAHARPPIPYAPRLPEPRPAAPGIPAGPPAAPKSGGGGP